MAKALELWHRAGKLGSVNAYHNLGTAYMNGHEVEVDMKKAKHYYELAAVGGDVAARYNLGVSEKKEGNMDRALMHYMIASKGGCIKSVVSIKQLYMKGHVTKDDYTKALRSHLAYLDEIRSPQRNEAAAAEDDFKYHE